MNCTRCHGPLTEADQHAIAGQAYCEECWIITYYAIDPNKAGDIYAAMFQAVQFGVDRKAAWMLYLRALRRHGQGIERTHAITETEVWGLL